MLMALAGVQRYVWGVVSPQSASARRWVQQVREAELLANNRSPSRHSLKGTGPHLSQSGQVRQPGEAARCGAHRGPDQCTSDGHLRPKPIGASTGCPLVAHGSHSQDHSEHNSQIFPTPHQLPVAQRPQDTEGSSAQEGVELGVEGVGPSQGGREPDNPKPRMQAELQVPVCGASSTPQVP